MSVIGGHPQEQASVLTWVPVIRHPVDSAEVDQNGKAVANVHVAVLKHHSHEVRWNE